jgi:hypothetical protein
LKGFSVIEGSSSGYQPGAPRLLPKAHVSDVTLCVAASVSWSLIATAKGALMAEQGFDCCEHEVVISTNGLLWQPQLCDGPER